MFARDKAKWLAGCYIVYDAVSWAMTSKEGISLGFCHFTPGSINLRVGISPTHTFVYFRNPCTVHSSNSRTISV